MACYGAQDYTVRGVVLPFEGHCDSGQNWTLGNSDSTVHTSTGYLVIIHIVQR